MVLEDGHCLLCTSSTHSWDSTKGDRTTACWTMSWSKQVMPMGDGSAFRLQLHSSNSNFTMLTRSKRYNYVTCSALGGHFLTTRSV